MTEEYTPIRTAEDITDDVVGLIETIYDGWFADEPRIDWNSFIDRLELMGKYDLGSQMDSPAIKAIKKVVKGLKNDH